MKKITKIGEISWIVGNILCALGNCLASKSNFGVASIVAPAFALSDATGLKVGYCEYIIQGILLLLCCLIIGKFKGQFIATICNILFYGACFNIVDSLLSSVHPHGMFARIIVAAVGTLITSFAVALMLRTYIPPSAYEIFVREIAVAKGINMSTMKLVFDTSLLALAIVMMLALLGKWDLGIIGALTLISAFLNSVLIGFFGKIIDKYCEFSPAIPKLYNLLNPKTDK